MAYNVLERKMVFQASNQFLENMEVFHMVLKNIFFSWGHIHLTNASKVRFQWISKWSDELTDQLLKSKLQILMQLMLFDVCTLT